MEIKSYVTKPRPAAAIQWDGSAEMAIEIVQWVGDTAFDTPQGVHSSLRLNGMGRGGTAAPVTVETLEITYPVEIVLQKDYFLAYSFTKKLFKVYTPEAFHDKFAEYYPGIFGEETV